MTATTRRRRGWAGRIVAALVVALTLKTTLGVLGTFDVGFDDETIYLEAAHWAGKRFLPLADSSPLYPLWYRALSLFEPDPLRLYFLNWFILTASLPILLYALARRAGAPLAAAGIVAVAWSLSTSVMTWPFVSKFAVLVLGLGALAATSIRDRRLAVAVTAVALALAAYARAELAAPSLAFAGAVGAWCAWSLVKTIRRPPGHSRRIQRRRSALALAACVVAPLGLEHLFGDPHQGGRAFFAFGQHYALNVVEAQHLDKDPWTLWDRFAREAFPHATTITEAAQENPAAFAWHLRRNLSRLSPNVQQLLRPMQFFPEAIVVLVKIALVVVAAAAALGLLLRGGARLDRRLAAWLPLLVVLATVTAASTLIIHPREHYLLPLAWLALAALAAASARLRVPSALRARWWRGGLRALRPRSWVGPAALAGALALLFAALPTRRPMLPSLLAPQEPAPPLVHENRRTIEVLRALDLRGHVPILEPDHSRGVYAELDFVRVAQWEKFTSFWQFVRERQVAVVVINRRLREDPRFASDPEFLAFAAGEGEREDFELVPVPGTSVVLAVRRSVLARSGRR